MLTLLTRTSIYMLLLLTIATASYGATFTVNTTADPGDGVCDPSECTLREAMSAANANPGADTIEFSVTGTINLTAALPNINEGVEINGPGAELLTIRRDAGGLYRIFTVNVGWLPPNPQPEVRFSDITIANGAAIGALHEGFGGGIFISPKEGNTLDPTVHLLRCRLLGNVAMSGGAIYSRIYGRAGYDIGLDVVDSSFDNNQALVGSAIFNGDSGRLRISGTTLMENAGVDVTGSTIFTRGISVLIINSTLSGNFGSAIRTTGHGSLYVLNSTLSDNIGGGIASDAVDIFIARSIIALNTGTDLEGPRFNSGDHNLIGSAVAGTVAPQINDHFGVTADQLRLGPLGNHGGPTLTHSLGCGSIAIDNGSSSPILGISLTTDQRGEGYARTIDDPNVPNPPGGDGTDIGSFEFGAGGICTNVSLPLDVPTSQGASLTVPINVSNIAGAGAISYDAAISYDPAVLELQVSPVDKTGTLSASMEVNTGGSPGLLLISAFGTNALSGSGVLLNLKFTVVGTAPSFSNLNFNSFAFNEGNPCASTSNGSVSVRGTVSGTVSYATAADFVAVPDVLLLGEGSIPVSASSSLDGTYTLANFGAGPYTVTPSKTGDANGISALDASLISRFLVGTEPFTPAQQAAADVSNNGAVTSFDAALIAQYVVALPNPGITGTWRFIPASRSYEEIGTETGQDYDAILMGEVSGNWAPSSPSGFTSALSTLKTAEFEFMPQKERRPTGSITAALPSIKASPGQSLTIPVSLQFPASTQALQAYQFHLLYDPSVLQPESSPVETSGTLSSGLGAVANAIEPGRLRIAVYGSSSINSSGTLVYLKFRVVGSTGTGSPLTFNNLMFNEGDPAADGKNGKLTVRR